MLLTTTKVLYSVLSQNGFFCNYFVFIFVDFLTSVKREEWDSLKNDDDVFFLYIHKKILLLISDGDLASVCAI